MTNQGSGWLTIREAAIQLGVSELTIRRRIKDGKVAHRLENGKYYINFDEPDVPDRHTANAQAQTTGTGSGRAQVAPMNGVANQTGGGRGVQAPGDGATFPSGTASPPRPGAGEGTGVESTQHLHVDLDALLGEHRRLAEQVGRGSMLAERVRELEAREAQLQEALVSLSNRNGWLESKLEEREHEVKLLTDSNRRVSWWRRLFGAPATG